MNRAGVELLKKYEGCRLKAYKDPVGILTIGWGQTGEWIKPETVITQDEADWTLKDEIQKVEFQVNKLLKKPANENQLAAMICFAYNVGVGNYAKSTLLNCFNKGNVEAAAQEFKRWNKAGGHVLQGLVARRQAESELFSSTPV